MIDFVVCRKGIPVATYQHFKEECDMDSMNEWLNYWYYDHRMETVNVWSRGFIIGYWEPYEGWHFLDKVNFNGPNNTIQVN